MAKRNKAREDRIKACELAAIAISKHDMSEGYSPVVWCLAVFFESYIQHGAEGTRKEFGPSKPAKLKMVKGNANG